MVAFVLRRLFGMVIVLIVVSFIVYVIFFKIPGGDPAQRLAGRTATQGNITAIRHKLALDKPFYVQWGRMMEQLATGKLISYTDQLSVRSQIWQGIPVTFSLAIGAAIIWLFFGVLVGVISAVTAGGVSDRGITVLALIGVSMPVFWLGSSSGTSSPSNGAGSLTAGTSRSRANPAQWFYHLLLPWFTLAVLFIGFYGRVLRCEHPRHDQRRLRPHRSRQRSFASPRNGQARAAKLADPDRDVVRARLRRRAP